MSTVSAAPVTKAGEGGGPRISSTQRLQNEPPFAPMHPAPSPDTLRMGNQQFPPEHAAVRDPLRIYRQPGAEGETPLPEPNAGDQPETRKEP